MFPAPSVNPSRSQLASVPIGAGSRIGFASTSTPPSAGRRKRTRSTRQSAASGAATATQGYAEASGQRPCPLRHRA